MTMAAPSVLRKGALVRVSGGSQDAGADVLAHAFLDLRFPDGHIERWLGPARVGTVPDGADAMAALQLLAVEASDEFAFDIAVDVKRDFGLPKPPDVDHLPCEEVVFEWNHPARSK
jgi:hypothetical protein